MSGYTDLSKRVGVPMPVLHPLPGPAPFQRMSGCGCGMGDGDFDLIPGDSSSLPDASSSTITAQDGGIASNPNPGTSGGSKSGGSSGGNWFTNLFKPVAQAATANGKGVAAAAKGKAGTPTANWLDTQSNTTIAISGVAGIALLLALSR